MWAGKKPMRTYELTPSTTTVRYRQNSNSTLEAPPRMSGAFLQLDGNVYLSGTLSTNLQEILKQRWVDVTV